MSVCRGTNGGAVKRRLFAQGSNLNKNHLLTKSEMLFEIFYFKLIP